MTINSQLSTPRPAIAQRRRLNSQLSGSAISATSLNKGMAPEQEKGSTLAGSGAPFLCCEGGGELTEGNKVNEEAASLRTEAGNEFSRRWRGQPGLRLDKIPYTPEPEVPAVDLKCPRMRIAEVSEWNVNAYGPRGRAVADPESDNGAGAKGVHQRDCDEPSGPERETAGRLGCGLGLDFDLVCGRLVHEGSVRQAPVLRLDVAVYAYAPQAEVPIIKPESRRVGLNEGGEWSVDAKGGRGYEASGPEPEGRANGEDIKQRDCRQPEGPERETTRAGSFGLGLSFDLVCGRLVHEGSVRQQAGF